MEVPTLAGIQLTPGLPLQAQLYRHFTGFIGSGAWPPGTRLPASRRMAQELGVSRNTVTAVLQQLQSEGYLDSRVGSGVFVHGEVPDSAPEGGPQWRAAGHLPRLSDEGRALVADERGEGSGTLPFTLGVPDLEAFPLKTWNQIQRRHQDRRHLMGYDSFQGYRPLREALARYLRLSRQVRCEPDQIVITHGAQQAISLCAQLLLNDGDTVLVEDPGYRGARKAFEARNARLQAIEVGAQGLDSAALPAVTAAPLMYVTPTHHYPLGGIMSAAQRLQLLDWATGTGTWLIEDDYDSEYHFHGRPVASLQGMAPETPVIYMGSFSKTLFPALRLGYLVLPRELVDTFVAAKSHSDGETPLLSQATVAEFIGEGHFVRHLRRMRLRYAQKWQHLAALVDTELAGIATAVAESAGMHVVLRIDGIDDVGLAREFAALGFGGTALSRYYLRRSPPTGIALGFANSSEQQRQQGIRALAQLLPRFRV